VTTQVLPRKRTTSNKLVLPQFTLVKTGAKVGSPETLNFGSSTDILYQSEGHPINRRTGKRESGGPFYVVHSSPFNRLGSVDRAVDKKLELEYSGPIYGPFVGSPTIGAHYKGNPPSKPAESSMIADGATAIHLVAPTNPTANLSVALAEGVREGIPSLPGIQLWRRKTQALREAGSEYLNYQFGWAPLVSEVHSVTNAARHHRDIMQNYRHSEGRNTYRRFDFSPEASTVEEEISPGYALLPLSSNFLWAGSTAEPRRIICKNERKRWFEGCFTYGGPSGTDNFRRALGFGSDADKLYGLNLDPELLWELTPWSWAVDWFTNVGDVLSNISQFAAAGLVMRYGYMMEETISTYYTQYGDFTYLRLKSGSKSEATTVKGGRCAAGVQTVTKARCPANPFGFGVGWEGLSPTQLAITAALGITRVLK